MVWPIAGNPVAKLVAGLAAVALLAGCSGDGAGSGSPGEGDSTASTGDDSTSVGGSGSPSEGPSNYLEVGPKVELTPQGTELGFGKAAVVAWTLDKEQVAVVELRVTKVQRVPITRLSAWILDKELKASTPYYVHVKVENLGRSNLGGRELPLYVDVGDNRLIGASSFESAFKPCPSPAGLPEKFRRGAALSTCWVYLLPGRDQLENVSVFTGPGFDPLTWDGEVAVLTDKKSKRGGDKQRDGDKQGGAGEGDKRKGASGDG